MSIFWHIVFWTETPSDFETLWFNAVEVFFPDPNFFIQISLNILCNVAEDFLIKYHNIWMFFLLFALVLG